MKISQPIIDGEVPNVTGVPKIELKAILGQLGWVYKGDRIWEEPEDGKTVLWTGEALAAEYGPADSMEWKPSFEPCPYEQVDDDGTFRKIPTTTIRNDAFVEKLKQIEGDGASRKARVDANVELHRERSEGNES